MLSLSCRINFFYTETTETAIVKHKETKNQQNLGQKRVFSFFICTLVPHKKSFLEYSLITSNLPWYRRRMDHKIPIPLNINILFKSCTDFSVL